MFKKISIGVLLLSLLTSSVACSSTDVDTSTDTTSSAPSDVTTEYVEPDEDFGGEDFTIWYRNDGFWALTDIYVESENGDIINDAVYERNMEIENRFNVNFIGVASQTNGNDGSDTKALEAVILSGEDAYDVIVPSSATSASLVRAKYLVDFNTIPNIDLDNPWWDQNVRSTLSIKGKQYVMSSDLSVINPRAAVVLYFNRDIADSLNINAAEVFGYAKDGVWTFDKMMEVGKPATTDINGDGVMDQNDRYAFLHSWNSAKNLPIACDIMITGKNDNDELTFILGDERSISALTYLYEGVIGTADTLICYDGNEQPFFETGKGMFMYNNLIQLEVMRAQEFNFSILPLPKYNEDQENYRHQAPSWCTALIAVPITAGDLDMVGYILEKASEISSRTLIPTYYDMAITTKYSRDEESIEMLDIIFANIVHEPADMFKFANIVNALKDVVSQGANVTSFIEANESAVVAEIDALNELIG